MEAVISRAGLFEYTTVYSSGPKRSSENTEYEIILHTPKIENKHMAGKYGDGVGVSGRDAITTPEGC